MSSQGGNVVVEDVAETFLTWTTRKIYYDTKDRPPFYFFEREIWWAALGKNIGREIDGKHADFERPVLIIKKCSEDLCFVLPITTQIKDLTYLFKINFLSKQMAINISQARTISSRRLLRKMGEISKPLFTDIFKAFFEYIK